MANQAALPERADMQAAIKDINAVLVPKPKLNFITGTDKLPNLIVGAIAPLVGDDGMWKDERAGKLADETINTYNACLSFLEEKVEQGETTPPEAAEEEAPAPAKEKPAAPTPSKTECAGFDAGAGPITDPADPRSKECTQCGRIAECEKKAATQQRKETKEGPATEKKESAADVVTGIFINDYFLRGKTPNDEVQKILTKHDLKMNDALVGAWRRDINRILGQLERQGKLNLDAV